jgi:serine/threonine protein kinase
MGRVFLGLSPGGRPVAVKVVRAELASDPEFRTRFGQEVAAARGVSGVFTAPVLDADIDGPVAWLATAYVPGPSLAEAVDRHGPLPEGSVLALAAGLAESLTAIHAAGVVHQDLTPSNVLLAQDGPRVIDFGISQAAESSPLARAGPVIGSPGFMSPEQAMGGEVGPPSDIFSFGALLAFAATGQGPFGTGTTAALLYRVVHEEPSLGQVPAAMRPLLEYCLVKDPSQRPTASGLLAAVGRLQPTANWLPDSIIRTFAQDAASGQAFAGSDPAFAATGTAFASDVPPSPGETSDAWPWSGEASDELPVVGEAPDALPWSGEASTQVMAAVMGVSAAAAYSPTASSRSLVSPPGDAHRQPPPRKNRSRLRLGRPLVLACIIGALLIAGAFTLTSSSGSTSGSAQSQTAAQVPPSTARTSAGGKASASPSASRRASPKAPATSAAGIIAPASAPASLSPSPSASKKPTPPPRPPPTKKPTPPPPPPPPPRAPPPPPPPPPPTPTPSKKPTPTPTPTPTRRPTPTPTPTPTPPPTPTPTPTPTPLPTLTLPPTTPA